MHYRVSAIEYYLPESILNNEQLEKEFGDWTSQKIFEKTGIQSRHIAGKNECASDLAEAASRILFKKNGIDPKSIDMLILATQSPDYLLPTTACLLQDKLGLRVSCGAFDINLGCSAFIYGLAISNGFIVAGIAHRILLIMAETYSKHIHPRDHSVRTIFGDAAAAVLLEGSDCYEGLGEFVLGTDGSGAKHLIIPASGLKLPKSDQTALEETDEAGNTRTREHLFMDGPEIFNFTIQRVPQLVQDTLAKNQTEIKDIDLFIFHQANKFMLDYLKKKIKIVDKKFYVDMEDVGNTVSATIPIALKRAEQKGRLKRGDRVMLVGFGVGLSWGATILRW